MAEFSILSAFTSYRIKCPMCQLLWQTVGVGGGFVVVGCLVSVLWGEMLICCAFTRRRRRRCSFISCFQWIVNKQHLLSLQRRDGWLVSAAVSAIPIPNRYHWYRPDTDTEYWYRSKPNIYRSYHKIKTGVSLFMDRSVYSVLRCYSPQIISSSGNINLLITIRSCTVIQKLNYAHTYIHIWNL